MFAQMAAPCEPARKMRRIPPAIAAQALDLEAVAAR
jgi:hypothetical protein